MSDGNEPNFVWYTRCPVPSALSIAAQLGWLDADKDFLRDQGFLATDFALEDWIDRRPLAALSQRAVA